MFAMQSVRRILGHIYSYPSLSSFRRVLVENDYAGFTEDQVLQQIFIDEQFPVEDTAAKAKEEKQKLASTKAAIGYDYNEVGIRFQRWVTQYSYDVLVSETAKAKRWKRRRLRVVSVALGFLFQNGFGSC